MLLKRTDLRCLYQKSKEVSLRDRIKEIIYIINPFWNVKTHNKITEHKLQMNKINMTKELPKLKNETNRTKGEHFEKKK